MPILNIYKPTYTCRKDTETEGSYITDTPVDLGCDPTDEGIEIRLFVPGAKASWYGSLKLNPAQADKLKDDIDYLLNKYEPVTRVSHDIK